eukprot:scaffold85123_cov20-Tisochrysis_lutea.AAC.3
MAKSEAETGKHAQTHNHRSNVCLSKGPRTRRLCMYLTPSLTLDQGCPLPAKAFRQLFCGHWMEFSEETGMCDEPYVSQCCWLKALTNRQGRGDQGTCCSAGASLVRALAAQQGHCCGRGRMIKQGQQESEEARARALASTRTGEPPLRGLTYAFGLDGEPLGPA